MCFFLLFFLHLFSTHFQIHFVVWISMAFFFSFFVCYNLNDSELKNLCLLLVSFSFIFSSLFKLYFTKQKQKISISLFFNKNHFFRFFLLLYSMLSSIFWIYLFRADNTRCLFKELVFFSLFLFHFFYRKNLSLFFGRKYFQIFFFFKKNIYFILNKNLNDGGSDGIYWKLIFFFYGLRETSISDSMFKSKSRLYILRK